MTPTEHIVFEQKEPSALWIVDLFDDNNTPIAECYNIDTDDRIFPIEVKSLPQKQVTIRFSQAKAGRAYIIWNNKNTINNINSGKHHAKQINGRF